MMKKDSKVVGKAKENVKPSVVNRNKLVKRKKEITKPSYKTVNNKCKKNTVRTRKKYIKKNMQEKGKQGANTNSILKKVLTRKMSQPTNDKKISYERQFEDLKREMQESMQKVLLTNSELHTLIAKYKRDGHYRVEPNLPPISTFPDTSLTQLNAKRDTYNSSMPYNFSANQSALPDFVSSSETYSPALQNEHISSFAQNNNLSKDPPPYSNFTTNNQTYKLCNAYSSIQNSHEYAFNNSYSKNYDNSNIYNTQCIRGISNNNTQTFTQYYPGRQNPYCQSNTVHYRNIYDSNIPTNEPAALDLASYNAMPNVEHNAADSLNSCSVIRNNLCAQSNVFPSTSLNDKNTFSLDTYNYQSITKNHSEPSHLPSFSQPNQASSEYILPDVSNSFYVQEVENTSYDFPRENNIYRSTSVMPTSPGENFTYECNEFKNFL